VNRFAALLYVTWSIGVILFIYTGGQLVLARKHLSSFHERRIQTDLASVVLENKRVRSLQKYIEQKTSFSGVNWGFQSFMLYSLLTGVIGGVIALKYLNNMAAVLPLGVCAGLIPWTYVTYSIIKKQSLIERQLGETIQYFISEYGSLPNVVSALNSILPKIDKPIKTELDYLIRDMNSGISSEEALFSFAGRLNSRWAYRLVHILNLRMNKGINISAMLFNIYLDMNTAQIKEKERGMEIIGARLESYFLYLFIPGIYYLASKINPETHYILTRTGDGKRIMFVTVVIFLVGIMMTIRTGNTRIK